MYEEALHQGIARLWVRGNPQTILNEVAAKWDVLTEKIGINLQREVHQAWASKPNAYPN